MVYRQTAHTQAKKAGTRARILKEARLLVAGEGFGALTVAAVAQKSGIATGSIYRHFPSKADLVAEVFRHATEHELQAVTTASQRADSARQRLIDSIQTFAQRAMQTPRLAYGLIAEPVDPLVEKERLAYRFAYAEAYEDVINDGISQGEFVAQNAGVSAAMMVGMMAEALVGPLAPGPINQPEPDLSAQPIHNQLSDEKTKQVFVDELIAFALRAVGAKD